MRLQLPLKQRLGVMVLLCLGIIVTAAGTVRTYFVWLSLIGSWDETWYAYQLWISACVEIDLAVVSSILFPCLKEKDPADNPALRMRTFTETTFFTSNAQTERLDNLFSVAQLFATLTPAAFPLLTKDYTLLAHDLRPPRWLSYSGPYRHEKISASSAHTKRQSTSEQRLVVSRPDMGCRGRPHEDES